MTDLVEDHPLVGSIVEVSDIAQGTLLEFRGKKAKVLGVILRFGKPVAFRVKIKVKDGSEELGTARDFYFDRCLVEDAQPPTATSVALREGLSHWGQQRDYWHTDTGGLESLAFAVASTTPSAVVASHEWGWEFVVPEPMRGDFTRVCCPAFQGNNYWTMTTSVAPGRGEIVQAQIIEDHWARTFQWTHAIASGMVQYGWPWEKAAQNIEARAVATAKVLVPLVRATLARCVEARREITGEEITLLPVSAGFSAVRCKAGTIGLTEPPTDRRPYTVISVSPDAARDRHYLDQVVLHECCHVAVQSDGGPSHGDLFKALADRLGLEPQHQD